MGKCIIFCAADFHGLAAPLEKDDFIIAFFQCSFCHLCLPCTSNLSFYLRFFPVLIRIKPGTQFTVSILAIDIKQESANYSLLAKSSPLPVFINKILLEDSQTYLFTHHLRLLSCHNSRDEQLQVRPYGPQSQKYLLLNTFQNKFADPWYKAMGSRLEQPYFQGLQSTSLSSQGTRSLFCQLGISLPSSLTCRISPQKVILAPISECCGDHT